jgi:hypothetical protein
MTRRQSPEYSEVWTSHTETGEWILWTVSPTDFRLIPPEVHAYVGWAGYEVHADIDCRQTPRITQLSLRDRGEAGPIDGDVLRRFPIRDVLARAVDIATVRVTAEQLAEMDESGQIPTSYRTAAHNPRGRDHPERASIFLLPRGRKPDAKTLERETLEAARYYNDAIRRGESTPVEYVKGKMHASRRTAQRRIAAARERGLIKET